MRSCYQHLLSPVKIGNVILKNRMISSNALPHFLMGPETFPSQAVIDYQAAIARNGAAVVTTMDWSDPNQRNGMGDGAHFPSFNLSDPSVQNYMNQLADAIHFYHSKASVAFMPLPPRGYSVAAAERGPDFQPPVPPPCREMSPAQMREMEDYYAAKAQFYQSFGFDMITIHMAYNATVLAQFLSPLKNTRTDEYGGCVENRIRFPLEFCRAIRKACGPDFLIEVQISGEEAPGGITVEDTVAFARHAEGIIDIFQIRAADGDLNHPTGFNSTPTPDTLRVAEAIKASGAKVFTAPIGGFQDPDAADRCLAEGKTDLIAAARAFFCDPDYYTKILENRSDDIVPCIRCNRCHGQGMTGPWLSVCSVNPMLGLEHKRDHLVPPAPARKKRVAVVGGGPAGMNAAVTAARRGHQVTLYESSDLLGGQLLHADHAAFKWPVKDYKDYLVHQLKKLNVTVLLNTPAVPGELSAQNYDAVLLALGAAPVLPPVPGAEQCMDPLSVFGSESRLGRHVVVIGGSEIGTETALYLADCGHKVTVLTRQNRLAPSSERVHYYDSFRRYWERSPNFNAILNAAAQRVEPGMVTFLRDGCEETIHCDSIVACGGMRPRSDEAMAFADCADEVFFLGDCAHVGNIQTAVRTSYTAAVRL